MEIRTIYMRRTIALLLVLAACRSTGPAAGGVPASALDRHAPILMDRVQVPGMAVAVVNGDNVAVHNYGVTNTRTGDPVTDRTVFEAASLSKPVFAYAVMKLVEEGRLDLDRPLSSYVTQPYANDSRIDRITARVVLSHRTGFPNWRQNGKPLEILFEPGTRFSYSGEGYVYLQRAVEAITNEPFDAFMRRTVFEPLGMSDSSYASQPAYDRQKSWSYDDTGTIASRDAMSEPKSASTLHTTAADYGRFLSALLSRRGISEESVRQMLRPEVFVPESCAMCATLEDPGPLSETIAWGLGWSLVSNRGHRYFWHWGDNGNFKAFVMGDDPRKTAVVALMNGAGGLAIAADVAALALGDAPGSRSPAQAPLDWARYDRWDSPTRVALHDILRDGKAAVGYLRARPDVSEAAVNSVGYSLMRAGRVPEAVEVFRLNTQRHPDSWNTWDSLGEALAKQGHRDEAIQSYGKSVELNPKNTKGMAALQKLRAQ